MSSRPPAPPPRLSGFAYVRHLGSGGFADVYLYEEQLLGRRNVAVKVLLRGELMDAALANFTNEATLMAQLSNHPSIVSVHQAGISEDGRPFIVMEYCSRPNLQARYRAGRFSEAETLRIGVQIAGAVETAHRAGILHRDIKPANILVTDYGRPALTDFGIAATTAAGGSAAFSAPWAPPEAISSDRASDARSDVYSLAATLYTLLAGRTPFEIPGASNTTVDLLDRINTASLPKIGRSEVLPATEQVLATGMARNPDDRYPSAMAFARALQRVQIERGMQPTTVDVMEEDAELAERPEEGGRTSVRSVVTIDAQPRPVRPPEPIPVVFDTGEQVARPAVAGAAVGETQLRPSFGVEISPASVAIPKQSPRRPGAIRLVAVGVAGVAVVAGGIVAAKWISWPQQSVESPATSGPARPVDPMPQTSAVPQVQDLSGVAKAGKARFSWTNPAPESGDSYLWRPLQVGKKFSYSVVTEPTVTIAVVDSPSATCIEVLLRRENGRSADEPAQGCAK